MALLRVYRYMNEKQTHMHGPVESKIVTGRNNLPKHGIALCGVKIRDQDQCRDVHLPIVQVNQLQPS